MAEENRREQLLRRAKLLEKARAIEAQNSSNVAAIGVTDGPTPAAMDLGDIPSHAGAAATAGEDYDKTGFIGGSVGAAAKALDVGRGALTAPALAAALGGLTGKDVYRAKEHLQAINPTNLTTYPSASELYERAGVPEGAKLSDYLPGFSPKGEASWYQPEVGGALDLTLRGAGGLGTDVAIDPLTYMTFGAEPGVKTGLKNLGEKLSKREFGNIGTTDLKLGLQNLLQKPSESVAGLGKRTYRSAILPAEFEGAKFGKQDVGEAFYNAGIAKPFGLRERTQEAANKLLDRRNQIFEEAAQKGGTVDLEKAMAPAMEKIAEIRASRDPNIQWIADELEKKVKTYREVVSPGEDLRALGLPSKSGTPLTPREASNFKTSLYGATPDSTWNELRKTPEGAKITGPLSAGFRSEAEQAPQRVLGGNTAEEISRINEDIGKLIGTKTGQTAVEKQAERLAHNATSVSPSGTFKAFGLLGAHNPGEAAWHLVADKLADAVRVATMPTGYGLRKLGEGPMSGRILDVLTRRKFIEKGARGSEEQRMKRSGYGEE